MSTVFQNASTVTVLQGDYKVTTDSKVVFSTVLGSCIAACIYDEQNGVGGMNHFLLASSSGAGGVSARYGVHAMELLINGIMKKGALRSNLKAKVFGGAKMSANLSDIGANNADFVQRFLRDEGIPVVSSSVGGTSAGAFAFTHVRARHSKPMSRMTVDWVKKSRQRLLGPAFRRANRHLPTTSLCSDPDLARAQCNLRPANPGSFDRGLVNLNGLEQNLLPPLREGDRCPLGVKPKLRAGGPDRYGLQYRPHPNGM